MLLLRHPFCGSGEKMYYFCEFGHINAKNVFTFFR